MANTMLNRIAKFTALTTLVIGCIFLILHKPLPEGFTISVSDRIAVHIIEPVLRAVYYYPSQMFSDPADMIWWTRLSLNSLNRVINPIKPTDKELIVKNEDWFGVPVRIYIPENASTRNNASVLFFHGGGFALGNVEMYDSLTRLLAKKLNSVLVSVEYRLSPETAFPGQIQDCEAVVDYMMENGEDRFGIDTHRITLMGDSAGGNLATVVIQRRVAKRAHPEIGAQVLLYPLLQFVDLQTSSYRYFHKRLNGLALVDPKSIAYYYMFYAGIEKNTVKKLVPFVITNGHVKTEQKAAIEMAMRYESTIEKSLNYRNATIPARFKVKESRQAQELLSKFILNPDFCPLLREDLRGMPKSLIITCEYDALRDEGIIYAQRLKDAGVQVDARNYENGFHAMLNLHKEVEEAQKCVDDIVNWILNNV
ncbi:unnamed protein product [Caenorhabditis bovis]|uniref:Rhodanese domain-containing protein n=1 Tax=Caenorhabditis bovis TaxID=2654633 RepID=A0A8S1EJS6_9PELO|nr:unnamed protein product [Caenorhabditis bovis]